jgi:predicted component of type VI protein secretion system
MDDHSLEILIWQQTNWRPQWEYYMLVRTRRMKNSGKGAILHEGSSSSNEDTEMSPPAKSMVDELRTWMDTRLQERLEAFNENIQSGPTMVQTDTITQLLLQILNDQNGIMKKLEQAVNNTEERTQNIGTLVKGITQGTTT